MKRWLSTVDDKIHHDSLLKWERDGPPVDDDEEVDPFEEAAELLEPAGVEA
jgi:hypothetical protein